MTETQILRQQWPGWSDEAIMASQNIGEGMWLWVSNDMSRAAFVESQRRYGLDRPSIPVSIDIAKEMTSRYLSPLTEFTTGNKVGWRELLMPEGESGKVYAFTQ